MDTNTIATVVTALEEKRLMLVDSLSMANEGNIDARTKMEMEEDVRAIDHALKEVDEMVEAAKQRTALPDMTNNQSHIVSTTFDREMLKATQQIASELGEIKAALFATSDSGQDLSVAKLLRDIGYMVAG